MNVEPAPEQEPGTDGHREWSLRVTDAERSIAFLDGGWQLQREDRDDRGNRPVGA